MPGPVRLPRPMRRGPKTLTEPVPAPTRLDEPKVPCGEGQLPFPLALQKGGQLGYEAGVEVTDEGVLLLHGGRVAGAGRGRTLRAAMGRGTHDSIPTAACEGGAHGQLTGVPRLPYH